MMNRRSSLGSWVLMGAMAAAARGCRPPAPDVAAAQPSPAPSISASVTLPDAGEHAVAPLPPAVASAQPSPSAAADGLRSTATAEEKTRFLQDICRIVTEGGAIGCACCYPFCLFRQICGPA